MTFVSKERDLWRAVILQAISDATSTEKRKSAIADKAAARQWFTIDNQNFRGVCDLADMDPIKVRRKALEAIAASDSEEPHNPALPYKHRAKNSKIAFDGRSMTITEWARHLGTSYSALAARLRSDWSIEHALSTPFRSWRTPGAVENFGEVPRDRRGSRAQHRAQMEKNP